VVGITFFQLTDSELSSLAHQSTLVSCLPYETINIGDSGSITKTITNEELIQFAKLTGDVNPIHFDDEYAKTTQFQGRIVHGMLVASYISTVLGTKLPGKDTIYLSQYVQFKRPVKIGDTLTITATVIEKRDDKKIIALKTEVTNQHGEIVLTGTANVMKNERSQS
jgi:3-hydroxybutyryl-CoA dehydratase